MQARALCVWWFDIFRFKVIDLHVNTFGGATRHLFHSVLDHLRVCVHHKTQCHIKHGHNIVRVAWVEHNRGCRHGR